MSDLSHAESVSWNTPNHPGYIFVVQPQPWMWPAGPPHNPVTPLALLEGCHPKAKKEITKEITESHPPQLRRHCAHIKALPDRFTRPGVHRACCLATAVTHDSDSFAIAGSFAQRKCMQNFMRMHPKVLTRETSNPKFPAK